MTFWLLQAMNDIDPDLVERAAQRPRKAHPLRWVAAVAAAFVMVAGVGVWWHNRPEDIPPVTHSTNPTGDTAISTTSPISTEIPTTTTTAPNGIGGDEWSCDGCSYLYHNFDVELIRYIGSERFHAWIDAQPTLPPDRTYPYHDCLYPDSTIIACVEYFGVTREQFIEIMGWEDVLDHVFVDSIVFLDDPSPYLYTFGDFVDAIYGDDPHLTAWVFGAGVAKLDHADPGDDWAYQTFYLPDYDIFYPDPLVTYAGGDPWTEGGSVYTFIQQYGRKEEGNIIAFVEYFDITREQFIDIYGWRDKLDEKATDHFAYAPYTYRQFVDAVYGDDEALRDWVFDRYVFHPDYPKAP
ncbi:MAG: hypothetical protein IJN04_02890 [Clostridia bacterium]|nr:hypothetical protein [Clostridia bacterium]